MTVMKVKAIAPWFGGKRTMGPDIVAELGPHQKYDEPFCGSLAVLFAKERCTMETVNDLHGDLINLARVLSIRPMAHTLYDRLRSTLMHETLFHEAAERWRSNGHSPASDAPNLDRAADFMVCSWFGRNGVAGTSSYNQGFCVRYTKNGGHAGTRWVSVVESIPVWHERLRAVTILNRDGLELLERLEDAPGYVIYCDPPYLKETVGKVSGSTKYVHDFEADDHVRLAALLTRYRHTRIVVSYYDDPRLEQWYPGWTIRHMKVTKALVNQGMRDKGGAVAAPEVLLINGPSLTESTASGQLEMFGD